MVIDPTTLVTLDRRTLAEGLAEAVKHAAIKDASMLHELKGLGPELSIGFSLNTIARLPDLISRNVAIKARIVEMMNWKLWISGLCSISATPSATALKLPSLTEPSFTGKQWRSACAPPCF